MPKKKTTFETDIGRLSEIIEQVENSETSLDDAVKLYKEGLELAAKCGKALSKYEEEILILQKDADENFTVQSFTNKM
jgi:exodeoxyribonuclease VII small subunit